MLVNNEAISAVSQGFSAIFNEAFEKAEPQWNKVAMEVKSTTKINNYGWLKKSSRFRKWLGDRVVQNLSAHHYTIENISYENTIGVDRDDIEDDNMGVYAPFIEAMGEDAKMHPDELVFELLSNGFTELCYDGQPFFDADHPVADADGVIQSVSNFQSGSATPWYLLSVGSPIMPLILQRRRDYQFVAMDDPTDKNVFSRKEFQYGIDARLAAGYGLWQMAVGSKATLDKTNFQAAVATLLSVKDDSGKPLIRSPQLLLVVPPSLRGAAKEILEAERDANGATNTERNTAELLVVPYLAA